MRNKLLITLLILGLISCTHETPQNVIFPKGKLYIIGGGKRPVSMIKEMIKLSGVDTSGYIIVLPMASSEPDTSAWYGMKQFKDQNISNVFSYNIQDPSKCTQACLDSIHEAHMIYITGGDQARFMKIVRNTPVHKSIISAYNNGALIAGTSAGAAVMSKKMITGNEYKHPEYTGDFKTIEADNIELLDGLGLLENSIIDQHFVWRMRMNRLISVALENPGYQCFGIDESTALVVIDHNTAYVSGESQVVYIFNSTQSYENKAGLLGGRGLQLDILIPGDTVKLR